MMGACVIKQMAEQMTDGQIRRLAKYLYTLKPRYRHIFLLTLEGKTQSEISRELSMQRPNVSRAITVITRGIHQIGVVGSTVEKRLKTKVESGLYDNTQMLGLIQEIGFIRQHRCAIRNLLAQEDSYNLTHLIQKDLGGVFLESVRVKFTAENFFGAARGDCDSEPFITDLQHFEYANYLSAIRQSVNSEEFGGRENWIVWVDGDWEGKTTLQRFHITGNISNLRNQFPDELTRLILRDAGVNISHLHHPRLILKV